MARLYLNAAKHSKGMDIIAQHLIGLGHQITYPDHDAVVCWGMSHPQGSKPTLNSAVNRYDKFSCFEAFQTGGVLCPEVVLAKPELGPGQWPKINGVWLARRKHHTRGRDIVVCETADKVLEVYYRGLHDFFSVFIPTKTEYRAWVWRKRLLTVHEKIFKGPGAFKGYVRNYRFGFHFQKREELREDPRFIQPCVGAVKALELDFGAVDLLEGLDGKLYVLEVNSTPAIDSPQRSSGKRLAAAISRWTEDVL